MSDIGYYLEYLCGLLMNPIFFVMIIGAICVIAGTIRHRGKLPGSKAAQPSPVEEDDWSNYDELSEDSPSEEEEDEEEEK